MGGGGPEKKDVTGRISHQYHIHSNQLCLTKVNVVPCQPCGTHSCDLGTQLWGCAFWLLPELYWCFRGGLRCLPSCRFLAHFSKVKSSLQYLPRRSHCQGTDGSLLWSEPTCPWPTSHGAWPYTPRVPGTQSWL